MTNSIAVDLVQKSELSNKAWFMKLMQDISNEDFHKFCKEIMFLREYYDSTMGLYATEDTNLCVQNEDLLFRLDEIDFDAEVNFKVLRS